MDLLDIICKKQPELQPLGPWITEEIQAQFKVIGYKIHECLKLKDYIQMYTGGPTSCMTVGYSGYTPKGNIHPQSYMLNSPYMRGLFVTKLDYTIPEWRSICFKKSVDSPIQRLKQYSNAGLKVQELIHSFIQPGTGSLIPPHTFQSVHTEHADKAMHEYPVGFFDFQVSYFGLQEEKDGSVKYYINQAPAGRNLYLSLSDGWKMYYAR